MHDAAYSRLRLVGYLPKNTAMAQGWIGPSVVTEVCSLCDCVNSNPEGCKDLWIHNELGLFDTREIARSVTPAGSAEFTMFAYRLLLHQFGGFKYSLSSGNLPVEPLPSTFVPVGFDVVLFRSFSEYIECSPLSCFGRANDVRVNCFCLVDHLDAAIELAERFLREWPPGPYCVVEVHRELERSCLT